MSKLHGFSRSNYFNAAKMALLEKGAAERMAKVADRPSARAIAEANA
jgi:hypothetical protein